MWEIERGHSCPAAATAILAYRDDPLLEQSVLAPGIVTGPSGTRLCLPPWRGKGGQGAEVLPLAQEYIRGAPHGAPRLPRGAFWLKKPSVSRRSSVGGCDEARCDLQRPLRTRGRSGVIQTGAGDDQWPWPMRGTTVAPTRLMCARVAIAHAREGRPSRSGGRTTPDRAGLVR